MIKALIWDVDGTLSETEETHRAAFNAAFAEAGLGWNWDRATYRRLLLVTGGKERIAAHSARIGPALPVSRVTKLHRVKTIHYGRMIKEGQVQLRPGVMALIRAARAAGLHQAIATTTSRPNVEALISATLGQPADQVFDVIAAGDEVSAKKPAPDVYQLALSRLGLAAGDCIAIEDSLPGLASARAAGLRVLITPSAYTDDGDFAAADWVLADLTRALPPQLAEILAPA